MVVGKETWAVVRYILGSRILSRTAVAQHINARAALGRKCALSEECNLTAVLVVVVVLVAVAVLLVVAAAIAIIQ